MTLRLLLSCGALAGISLIATVAGPPYVVCAQAGCAAAQGEPRGWGKGREIRFDISALSDDGGDNSPRKQARRAFAKWHAANQLNGSNVRFTEVVGGTSEFKVTAEPVLGKRAETSLGTGSGGSNQATVSANTKLNLGNTDYFDPAQTGYHNAIEKVMLHEIGHTMGITSPTEVTCADQTPGASVMNCASGVNDQDGLTADDVRPCDRESVSAIYGGMFAPRRDDDGDGVPYEEDCDDTRSDLQTSEDCARWECEHVQGWVWFEGACVQGSPILLPLGDPGQMSLSTAAGGVLFDLNGDGRTERIAWTEADSGAAWLALDRNGNGAVDNGLELFGNFTPQPVAARANGFLALGVFDSPDHGGNSDGWIDPSDAIFDALLLWRDINHDGVSQQSELMHLLAAGVQRISLDYKEASRRDRAGNLFRYRAKVEGTRTPWAYDVFLRIRQEPQ